MSYRYLHNCFVMLMAGGLVLASAHVNAEDALTLPKAEKLALERDPILKGFDAKTDAYYEQAEAEDEWPDPRIKLGWLNYPTDTYSSQQEPMTQRQITIEQMLPRGNTNVLKSKRAMDMAMVQKSGSVERRRKVKKALRQAWLELFYWERSRDIVRQNRKYFTRLVNITRKQYAAGRQKQQDVIRAQLELDMLDDRSLMIDAMLQSARADIEKWVGPQALQSLLPDQLPDLPGIDINRQQVLLHPLLKAEEAKVMASAEAVALVREGYKPQWMLSLSYGDRDGFNPNGSERSDFVSAMISFDLPFATGFSRQGHRLAASKLRQYAAMQERAEKQRELDKLWESKTAAWQRLGERVHQYKKLILPTARENTRSALSAYTNQRGDFTALMRAQITELETKLKAIRINVDYKKIQADLLYLTSDA